MNLRVLLIVGVVAVGIAWFFLVYPSYLTVMECSDAGQSQIDQISAERNQKVYVSKTETCPIERDLISTMHDCFESKKQESFINAIMLWYPPITFEYQKLQKQHSVQCFDDSPAFYQ